MNRLTRKDLNYCEVTGCKAEICKIDDLCYEYKLYAKLKEYEDLEEQGLLLRLPVKIGEPCSVIRIAEERTIVNGFLRYVTLCVETEKENMLMHPHNVFANEKEAEQKLKEMEE